jgi:hypothetical protein
MVKEYERPELYSVYVEVEHGFSYSTTLDDMRETLGDWE